MSIGILSARLKREIAGVAAAFLVVESVDAHISFLDFFCAIVERIQALALRRHDKNHIGREHLSVPPDSPLGSDFENFSHNLLGALRLFDWISAELLPSAVLAFE